MKHIFLLLLTGLSLTVAQATTIHIRSDQAPYVYAWERTNIQNHPLGDWPGYQVTSYRGGCYNITINDSDIGIVIHDYNGHQTGDIYLPLDTDYYFDWSGNSFYTTYNDYYDPEMDNYVMSVDEIPQEIDFRDDQFIYFVDPGGNFSDWHVYAWDAQGNSVTNAWPGDPISYVANSPMGPIYLYRGISGNPVGIIFNADGASYQTFDLKFESGAMYTHNSKKKGGVAHYISKPVQVTEQTVPDSHLRNELLQQDADGDHKLTYRELLLPLCGTTRGGQINVPSSTTNLTGLDMFTDLSVLYVQDNNNITSLDLSPFTKLEYLYTDGSHHISGLNLPNPSVLRHLECQDCAITNLSLNYAPLLNYLDCSQNRLSSINLYNNDLITDLNCSYNFLSAIDGLISHSGDVVTTLNYGHNPIQTHPQWNKLPKVQYFGAAATGLSGLVDFDEFYDHLIAIDCSNNTIAEYKYGGGGRSLESLNLSHNYISSLYEGKYLGQVQYLDVSHNKLPTLYASQPFENLAYLDAGYNRLTQIQSNINHSRPENLLVVHVNDNLLMKDQNLKEFQNLELFNCVNNPDVIGVYGCGQRIETLLLGGDPERHASVFDGVMDPEISQLSSLKNLSLRYCDRIRSLNLDNQRNQFSLLDVSGTMVPYDQIVRTLPNLRQFYARDLGGVANNNILDLSNNARLHALDVANNSLVDIDFGSFGFDYMNVMNNLLTELDVLPMGALDCRSNKLRTLDFNTWGVPHIVDCAYNYITSLDMSHDGMVPYMFCGNFNMAADFTDSHGYNMLPDAWVVDDDNIHTRYIMDDGCGHFHNNGYEAIAYRDDAGHSLFYLDETNPMVMQYGWGTLDQQLLYGFNHNYMTMLTGGRDTTSVSVGQVLLLDGVLNGRITYRHLTGFTGQVFEGTYKQLQDYYVGRDTSIVYCSPRSQSPDLRALISHDAASSATPHQMNRAPLRVGETNVDYTNLEFYVDWQAIPTSVTELTDQASVVGKDYYNALGVHSSEPFEGVNIVVTRYSNGTTRTSKMVK